MIDLDPVAARNAFFGIAMAVGAVRMVSKYRARRAEKQYGDRPTDARIREEVAKGHHPRAIRMYRQLHGAGPDEARAAIEAIAADLDG